MALLNSEELQTKVYSESAAPLKEIAYNPSAGDVIKAAFRQENSVGSLLAYGSIDKSEYNQDFDPFEHIHGYEDYARSFVEANNLNDVERIKLQIDKEIQDKEILSNAGALGVISSIAAGTLDPINLIPIGGQGYRAYKVGKLGKSLLSSSAKVALAGGAGNALQEIPLQLVQKTRTAEESALSVGGGVVLGGVLGAAAGYVGHVKAIKAQTIEELAKAIEEYDYDFERPFSTAGAKQVLNVTLNDEKLVSAAGVEKLISFQDPVLRTATSPSLQTRLVSEALVDQNLLKRKNIKGIATETSVESLMKIDNAKLYEAFKTSDNLFIKYRTGRNPNITDNLKIAVTDTLGRNESFLKREKFLQEVGKAMRNGDRHYIPEVAEAAREYRRIIFEPMKNEAIRLGLLPENVEVTTADSYLTRVYDREKIIQERGNFEKIVRDYLVSETQRKNFSDMGISQPSHVLDDFERAAPENYFIKSKTGGISHGYISQEVADAIGTGISADIRVYNSLQKHLSQERILSIQEQGYVSVLDFVDDVLDNYDAIYKGRGNTFSLVKRTGKDNLVYIQLELNPNGDFYKVNTVIAARKDYLNNKKLVLERAQSSQSLPKAKSPSAISGKTSYTDNIAGKNININMLDEQTLGEIDLAAKEVVDKILGHAADGRIDYGGVAITRGPLKERIFNIPDSLIEDYLESNIEDVAKVYLRTLSPDLALTSKFGSADMRGVIRAINDDYDRIASKIAKERMDNKITIKKYNEALKRIEGARKADIRDIEAMRDRLRGTYNIPDDPDSYLYRTGKLLRTWNYITRLGGMTISAFTDLGGIIFTHGFDRCLADGLLPLVRNFRTYRLAAEEIKLSGTALDMILDSRGLALSDVFYQYGRGSKLERAAKFMSDKMSVASLMGPWNASLKQFAGIITQARVLKACEAWSQGKIKTKEIMNLAKLGIDEITASRISEQFKKYGEIKDRVYLARMDRWDDSELATIYKAAMNKEVDRIIVTPGQDKPLFMSKDMGAMIMQFKSFGIAAAQRVLLAGLQRHDAEALQGAITMIGLGMLVHYIKTPKEKLGDNTGDWVVNGLDRSGLMGWFFDINNTMEKLTSGRFGLSRFTGEQAGRYQSRNVAGTLAGPTVGTIEDMVRVIAKLGAENWTEADTKAFRRQIPFQNLFYMRWLFDKMEEGVNDFLGVSSKKDA